MSQPSDEHRSEPPYNPGLYDLIEGKQLWSSPLEEQDLKRGFQGWHERGYLPHRDEPGLVQFVTFHLADSFPELLRTEWEHLVVTGQNSDRRTHIEAYLDSSRGACHLRNPEIAKLVEENFLRFGRTEHSEASAGEYRYELRAWVLMPNHVHVLFKVGPAVSMAQTVEAWKKNTARRANKLLGRRGAFWAKDYYDTYMRDGEHESKTVSYIENNPIKAKLVHDPRKWPWSSARFRDEFGILRL